MKHNLLIIFHLDDRSHVEYNNLTNRRLLVFVRDHESPDRLTQIPLLMVLLVEMWVLKDSLPLKPQGYHQGQCSLD